jgi:hypothetical protein
MSIEMADDGAGFAKLDKIENTDNGSERRVGLMARSWTNLGWSSPSLAPSNCVSMRIMDEFDDSKIPLCEHTFKNGVCTICAVMECQHDYQPVPGRADRFCTLCKANERIQLELDKIQRDMWIATNLLAHARRMQQSENN